ncbi:hypothetical protein [Brasilonema sp. UFV-L1]|uniref:hypothetical protein n=1 Tax=Brasilonema sp. UFV-L1 TaxID=2234130 RepID=UPI00145EC6D7|nr:hypothetical protein [Brasilonema sp. UFV-L1]NMG08018.1 hypothetical protein [Brasilonema sp. UFV-L1]
MYDNKTIGKDKISSEFAYRLNHLAPQQKVSVIVFLKLENLVQSSSLRQSRAERKAAIEGMRNSAKQALSYIREIIQNFGGIQLAENPDALGSIPIEISADGIKALAASDAVKAVVEEQEIILANTTNRFYIQSREC